MISTWSRESFWSVILTGPDMRMRPTSTLPVTSLPSVKVRLPGPVKSPSQGPQLQDWNASEDLQ